MSSLILRVEPAHAILPAIVLYLRCYNVKDKYDAMKKMLSDIYPQKNVRKNGAKFTTGQLFRLCVFWFGLLTVLFFVLKFVYDWFHLK